ncbi:hypothetical protein [Hasllibacter sp. MH4015]|uniref:hypothetical protein n=1 Tax=Hasllibacter sp. MH4015 TaxID=2854029 RepID=UPI001CD60E05|nr:hypothetical protein [Hasllibacter sp. MH4015]
MRDLRLIPAALFVAFPAAAQIEDAFAQFEARCLTPMEAVEASDTDGLTLTAEDSDSQTWMADAGAWRLSQSTPEALIQFCAIHGAFGTEVDDWVRAALDSGRYRPIDSADPAIQLLQSTTWREPLIEVEIDREGARLTVIETNLES